MDRDMVLNRLAEAEKAIAKGDRLVTSQQAVISVLRRNGLDCREATARLQGFIEVQKGYEAYWSQLLSQLNEQRPRCSTCRAQMRLIRVEPDKPKHDKRTFECPTCKQTKIEIIKYR
jgi:hypothetical protein